MRKRQKRILFQIGLFITTFITTTLAGTEWVYSKTIYAISSGWSIGFNPAYTWADFFKGMEFSVPLILILTVHEFGHYFAALYHKVKTSLPYYIPVPPLPILPFSIGTMGAVIRLRSRPQSNLQNFDIGLAGPLAGFIVALAILFYGFQTLPSSDYIFRFHPEYAQYGPAYAEHVYGEEYLKSKKNIIDVQIGSNLVFWLFQHTVSDPTRVPNAHEIMHYPILLACYIALFVTCLNLLPIGQLDGGHVVYGLFGFRVHKTIAIIFFVALMFYAGLGLPWIRPGLPLNKLLVSVPLYLMFLFFSFIGLRLNFKYTLLSALSLFAVQFLLMVIVPGIEGYQGWLLFGFILGRFIGVSHPPSEIEQPLDPRRVLLGWITLLVFILCFSPAPIVISSQ
jgi:membrane-associated protease RseP (regulator of RpoE activity)